MVPVRCDRSRASTLVDADLRLRSHPSTASLSAGLDHASSQLCRSRRGRRVSLLARQNKALVRVVGELKAENRRLRKRLAGNKAVQDEHDQSEIRPLPDHPRCRGISLGEGKYAGCPYGAGALTPLTGPCDCPIRHGSGFEGIIGTTLPHQCFGDPDCCGCLKGIIRDNVAEIVCNECEAVVRTARPAELQRALDEMELMLDVASAQCPDCGTTHLASGLSELLAFVCEQCGQTVRP
jgi:hypothetical protein